MSVSSVSSPPIFQPTTSTPNKSASGSTNSAEQLEGPGPDHDGDSDDHATAAISTQTAQATRPTHPSQNAQGTGTIVNKLA